jgi:hypothetical protein
VSDSNDASRKSAFSSADPPRNFSLSVGERIRALTIGAPAYAMRKKHIEDLEARHVTTLVSFHDALVARGLDAGTVRDAVQERAARVDLKKMNALIASHNRYYPQEANLPMDLQTGAYLIYGRPWHPEALWTAARLVEHTFAVIAARGER